MTPASQGLSAPARIAPTTARGAEGGQRLFVLDGWRAISILLVLATHMLPLGPKFLRLNETSGGLGMSLFFALSGFLITQQLHARQNVPAFLVRRLFRIVPLAWLYATIAVLLVGASASAWLSHLVFAVNHDGASMTTLTHHFWSLCVEVHFYVLIGLFMWLTQFRGFIVLPVIWIGLVLFRVVHAPGGTSETYLRVDEILAGACLALVHLGYLGDRVRRTIERVPFPLLAVLLLLASHPWMGWFNALRGLIASTLVGHTLFHAPAGNFGWLGHRWLRYLAETSYAIYIIHPLTMYGWLGSGPWLVKYAKRILCFALTFGLSHLSTYYFERRFLELGKKLAARFEEQPLSIARA